MPKISIIVPVYKAEQYLARCIDSILGQTFSDFELILVDDGSPDRCSEICDSYAEKDCRIRVLHRDNAGAAAARNVGLDAAAGEYILFCDSDDVVSPSWAEHLYAGAKEGKTLAVCAYCNNAETLGAIKETDITSGKIYPHSHYYEFNKYGLAGFLCNAIFRRDIIEAHHIRLRENHSEGDFNEDLLFTLTYVQYVERLTYVGFADYLYDTREGSLSRSFDRFYFKKYEEKYRLWRDFLLKYAPEDKAVLSDLSEGMLYHFFVALKAAFAAKDRTAFAAIVQNDSVVACAGEAQNSKENPRLQALLAKKRHKTLWLLYRLQQCKNKLFKHI